MEINPLLISWLFCFWFLCCSSISSQCLQHQRSLLLQLKHELSIDLQKMEDDSLYFTTDSKPLLWDLKMDCCLWDGITCDQSGYVIGLDLSYSYISSGINSSSSLFNLLKLQSLNLAYNYLYRPFPTGFSRLSSLTSLNLSNSGFSGQIPLEISQLNRLVYLNLNTYFSFWYANSPKLKDLELEKLVENLTSLRVLILDGIDMSMVNNWCQVLSQSLPSLRHLSLSECGLTRHLHPSLLQLKLLTHLHLNGNNFSQLVPDFLTEFSFLTSLELSYSGFYGRFPSEIFLMPTLKVLDVSYNSDLIGNLPEFIPGSSLQVIVLSGTRFFGKLPNSIHNLDFLEELELYECSFYGSIPTSFENLTELRSLDLWGNNFSGPLPLLALSKKITTIIFSHNHFSGVLPASYVSELNILQSLELTNNSLSGTILSELFTKPSIRKLLLNQNQFTGQLEEFRNASSSQLWEVNLSENKFRGPIPNSIFNISSLYVMRLHSNQFTGTIGLHMMRNINNLRTLDLSDNKVSFEVSATNSTIFSKLGRLGLGSCNITRFPISLQNSTNLYHLDLSNNRIDGTIPNWIWDVVSLVYLNLSNNILIGFERPGPNLSSSKISIVDLHSNSIQGSLLLPPPNIFFLDYSNNKFSSSLPSDLYNRLANPVFISLSQNDFDGEIPKFLCKVESLEVMDLSNNKFNGSIPSCLLSNMRLKVLSLRSNKLHGAVTRTYKKNCSLRTLDLNHNHLEGPLPISLAKCRDLEILDLGNNHLHGSFPFWLAKLPRLRVLILQSNNFSGDISYSYSKNGFQMLQIIDLSSNNFLGRIPSGFFRSWKRMINPHGNEVLRYGYLELSGMFYQDAITLMNKGLNMQLEKILTIFTCIDLSNNHFEGWIPETLGDLTLLYVLNLSHNHLSGHIPSSFGKLKELGSLDLSSNKLSGKIPRQFIKLTFLSFLNLSHNLLAGEIPRGGQLDTFTAASFEGNTGLCGFQLSTCVDKQPPSLQNAVPEERPSKSFFGLDMDSLWIGFACGGGMFINVGVIAGIVAANHILKRRIIGRRFRSTMHWFGRHLN